MRAVNQEKFPGVIGTFMGRDALTLAATVLGLRADDTVLLPCYLCNEVVKPFLGRCRVEFYPIRPGLMIDPEVVRKRLSQSRVKALVMINYFGFLEPQRIELKKLCAEYGTTLVEDCALSLLSENSGQTGDLAIYSFRKTLPIPDGGGLKANGDTNLRTPEFRPQIVSDLLSLCVVAKQRLKIRTERLSRSGLSSQANGAGSPTRSQTTNPRFLPMSSFARRGIRRASFVEIIKRQRQDFLFWSERVASTKRCEPIYQSLPTGVCPLGFPIKIQDRNEVRTRLQGRGIYLKVHWRVPAAVGSDFPESHALSAQMLTLPVYPELGQKERREIVRELGLE
jgi:perosamine synthetase